MAMTAPELNRATLARQGLLRRERLPVPEAVRRWVGLQAQHPASPYLSLWNRLEGFDPTDLDAGLLGGDLVKATLLRLTLHVVHADDHPWLHRALRPTLRAARLGDRRFTSTGLTPADADALVPDLLDHLAVPRTSAQAEAWLESRVPGAGKAVWWALRSVAPLVHAPTGGPWVFGARPAFTAARTPALPDDGPSPDRCLESLVLRHLAGYGPATVADVAQFALVQRARAGAAMAALAARDAVERVDGPGRVPLWDVPGAPRPPADTPAPPRLLGMWDDVLLAHADRSRLVPPDLRRLVSRVNGDVLPTLLVDGHVAGVWRPVDGGIEATALHPLADDAWDGLAEEARSLGVLLADREPEVYRRYGHWWSSLPAAQVRTLPAGGA